MKQATLDQQQGYVSALLGAVNKDHAHESSVRTLEYLANCATIHGNTRPLQGTLDTLTTMGKVKGKDGASARKVHGAMIAALEASGIMLEGKVAANKGDAEEASVVFASLIAPKEREAIKRDPLAQAVKVIRRAADSGTLSAAIAAELAAIAAGFAQIKAEAKAKAKAKAKA